MSSQIRSSTWEDRWRLWPALLLIFVPFLGLIGMQGYQALSRLPRAAFSQRLVAHSFRVIVTAQSLRSALEDAERGQRGYLLTGRSSYLQPYQAAIARVPHLLGTLTRLTADDPIQRRQIPVLTGQIDLKLKELHGTIEAYRSAGMGAAHTIVESNAALHEMDSIESGIDVITATEDGLLSRRLARVDAQERTMQRIALASTLLGSALMMSGLLLAMRNFRKGRRQQLEISRRAEEAAHANLELERRNLKLAQATELARQAQETARQAERAKGRFLATASHDLRQPLQAVSLLNGLVRRIAQDPDISDALKQQDEAIGAMSRLLNALLDISKLESGAVKPEPADFAVSALLETMAREFRSVAANKGLTLHVEPCEAFAHSDPALVEQILRNLVSNAIKYTRAGEVRLCAIIEPPWVGIEVIDTGVGIPQDQIALLGDEFYQIGVASNTTREGYGLGLSIVRRLVQLLELRIDVRSEVGRGSTFTLKLREGARPAVAASPQTSPKIAHGARAAQILLVEDDPEVRNATRMLLKAEGYGVTSAASSQEAEQRAREDCNIALVVTDFHLGPGETGVQVILRLREVLRRPVKAVLITGDTSSAIKELPPDPHLRVLSKPVQAETFLGLVSELLVT